MRNENPVDLSRIRDKFVDLRENFSSVSMRRYKIRMHNQKKMKLNRWKSNEEDWSVADELMFDKDTNVLRRKHLGRNLWDKDEHETELTRIWLMCKVNIQTNRSNMTNRWKKSWDTMYNYVFPSFYRDNESLDMFDDEFRTNRKWNTKENNLFLKKRNILEGLFFRGKFWITCPIRPWRPMIELF